MRLLCRALRGYKASVSSYARQLLPQLMLKRLKATQLVKAKLRFPPNFNSSLSCCLLADESEVEQITATPCGPQPFPPSPSSSSSVTSQPTPRTDPLLHRTPQDPPAAAAGSDPPSGPLPPPPPPPDADKPKPSPSGGGGGDEEEEEGGGGARGAKDTKHRTLLEIDRFTLCGNRID